MKQKEIFQQEEGDAWFFRNRGALSKGGFHDVEILGEVLHPFRDEIGRILEIGCCGGDKLSQICDRFSAQGSGLDPSSKAISEGRSRYQGLDLKVGTADALPWQSGAFEIVYFGFCLYLVDRVDLLKAFSEADRVLRPGGFLAILDFDPQFRTERSYHHRAGVKSYKGPYHSVFEALGHYTLVEKRSLSHVGPGFVKDPGERVAIHILYKEPQPYLPG